MRRFKTAFVASALIASACGSQAETTNPATPSITPGTYRFAEINGGAVPWTDVNGTTWAAGQWVVRSDRTFTASFTLTGTGAGTRTETGWMIGINTEPLYVTYSSGTQSIAVPTETGLTVNLGANFLRFVR